MPDIIKKPFEEAAKALGPQQQKMQAHPTGPGVPPGSIATMLGGVPSQNAWGGTTLSPIQYGFRTPTPGGFMPDATAGRQYRQDMAMPKMPAFPIGAETGEPPMAPSWLRQIQGGQLLPPSNQGAMGNNENPLLAALLGRM